ncbi:MAG: hypothetical protein QNL33_07960 [Akkermansiaceae bacterium]
MPNGIPCANTFLRLFAAIDPAVFGECLVASVTTLAPDLKGRLVNIDGKTLRGSRKADESTVQIVSAWGLSSEGVDDGAAPAGFITTNEHPILRAKLCRTDRFFGVVVVKLDLAVHQAGFKVPPLVAGV